MRGNVGASTSGGACRDEGDAQRVVRGCIVMISRQHHVHFSVFMSLFFPFYMCMRSLYVCAYMWVFCMCEGACVCLSFCTCVPIGEGLLALPSYSLRQGPSI